MFLFESFKCDIDKKANVKSYVVQSSDTEFHLELSGKIGEKVGGTGGKSAASCSPQL